MWVKIGSHPCWKVQKSLDDMGIEYEVVKGPLRRGRRDDVQRVSGQHKYPVIEFEDGSAYREESKDMAARIRAGRLFEKGAGPASRRTTEAAPTRSSRGGVSGARRSPPPAPFQLAVAPPLVLGGARWAAL
jgi:hypothetical protein